MRHTHTRSSSTTSVNSISAACLPATPTAAAITSRVLASDEALLNSPVYYRPHVTADAAAVLGRRNNNIGGGGGTGGRLNGNAGYAGFNNVDTNMPACVGGGQGGRYRRFGGHEEGPLSRHTKIFSAKIALVGSVGGLLYGYDLGVIAGALPMLEDDMKLTEDEQDMMVALLTVGAIVGSAVGGLIADRIGRLRTIMLTCGVFIVGSLILMMAQDVPGLLLGRVVIGFAVAVGAIADVAYLTELSPVQVRGALVSVHELMISVGVLLAFLVGYLLQGVAQGWRFMFGITGVLAFLQLVSVVSMPMSPAWLLVQGRREEASQVLGAIYGCQPSEELPDEERDYGHGSSGGANHGVVSINDPHFPTNTTTITFSSAEGSSSSGGGNVGGSTTFTDLQQQHQWRIEQQEEEDGGGLYGVAPYRQMERERRRLKRAVMDSRAASMKDLLWQWRPQLMMSILLGVIQQLTGNANVLSYAPEIFKEAGGGGSGGGDDAADTGWGDGSEGAMNSSLAVVILGVVKVYMTVVAVAKVDHSGRRRLLVIGSICMVFSLLVLGTSFLPFASEVSQTGAKYTSFVASCGVVAAYSVSYGPMTWLIVSELFPPGLRGRAIGTALVANWTSNFLVSSFFLRMLDDMGGSTTFYLFAALCAIGALYIYQRVPETLGKEPHEIAREIARRRRSAIAICRCWCGPPRGEGGGGAWNALHDDGVGAGGGDGNGGVGDDKGGSCGSGGGGRNGVGGLLLDGSSGMMTASNHIAPSPYGAAATTAQTGYDRTQSAAGGPRGGDDDDEEEEDVGGIHVSTTWSMNGGSIIL